MLNYLCEETLSHMSLKECDEQVLVICVLSTVDNVLELMTSSNSTCIVYVNISTLIQYTETVYIIM